MSLTKASYSLIQGAPVNILDYGASTSSADNTAAIQAAINTGLDVYIPAGTFLCTDTLSMNTPFQTLFGNGWGSQITFTFASSKEGLIMGVPTGAIACEKQTLRNVYLLGTANVSKLLNIKGPECNILNNRIVNNSAGDNIYLEDENTPTGVYCFGQRIINNFISGTSGTTNTGIRLGTYNQATEIAYNNITNCAVFVYVNGATTSLNINNNIMQKATAGNAAIYINRAGSGMPCYNINIANNYFEEIQFVVSVGDANVANLTITQNYASRNNVATRATSTFYVGGTNASAASQFLSITFNYIEDFGAFLDLSNEYSSRFVNVFGNSLELVTNYAIGTYAANAYSYTYANPYTQGKLNSGSLMSGTAQRIESLNGVIILPIDFPARSFATTLSFRYIPIGANAVTIELFSCSPTSDSPTSLGSVTASTSTTASITLNTSALGNLYYYAVATFNNAGTAGYLYPLTLTLQQ
jgi:hypothetical protein